MTCNRLDDDDDKSKAPLLSACAPRICYPASFLRLHRLQAPISYLTRVICSISRLLSSPALPRSFTQTKTPAIISAFRTRSSPELVHRLKLSTATTESLDLRSLHHLHTATSTHPQTRSHHPLDLALHSDFFALLCSLNPSSVIIINPPYLSP